MNRKRYIVELGLGSDLHGADVTKAAKRAVKDAVSRSCLCGLIELGHVNHPNDMEVEIRLACPFPEKVNLTEVEKVVPFGKVSLDVVQGGLDVRGVELKELGEGDTIVVAVAAITVYVKVN